MLQPASALPGLVIHARDGKIGTVSDLLFDDRTWTLRWLVAETGGWLTGRKVLLHPSAITHADGPLSEIFVALTRDQVERSPDTLTDQPVTPQLQNHLYDYYGLDPFWGSSGFFGAASMLSPLGVPPPGYGALASAADAGTLDDAGDSHLRSTASIKNYHILGTDGSIGHVENFLIDPADGVIRYLIIETRNWWPGEHVLISPRAVKEISWPDHQIRLGVTRAQIKAAPKWDPAAAVGALYQQQLHGHYGWPDESAAATRPQVTQ